MKHIKKSLALLLALLAVLPLCVFSSAADPVTVNASGFNKAREEGQLIIYTSDFGDTTQTNAWGFEIIVGADNRVSSLNANGNSAIPRGGFVLSGHDHNDENGPKMSTWLKENVKEGQYIYYNAAGLVTVSDTVIEESPFYELELAFNGVNTTRGTDMVIIYNSRGNTTATNEWGYEVVVTVGMVTAMGDNNNRIPGEQGSFVVSAHGKNVEWLQLNVKIGMTVKYNESTKKINFIYNENSALAGIETLYSNAEESLNEALASYSYIDIEGVKTELAAIKTAVDKVKADYKKNKDSKKLASECEKIEAQVEALNQNLFESKTVEYRGVWVRPTQTGAAEVDAYVESLYQAGINMVCIETIYDCTMILPMPEDSLFKTNPKFKNYDMLQAYIDSCHKRDMELHLWYPIYYVGNSGSSYTTLSLGRKKPEWLSVSNKGTTHQDADGYMLIDPANQEAADYLLSTYKYILENYDIDGFQLDYIRYYMANPETGVDYGYSEIALDAFEEKYGVRPTYDTKASYWQDWCDFRAAYITEFVSRVRKLIDETRPGVLLGADVVPKPEDGKAYYYQDYMTWLENGWLDILNPMSYGYGYEAAIKNQVNAAGDTAFIGVGLGIFMEEMTPEIIESQVNYNNTVNADGSVHFESSSYLNKDTGAQLIAGVYRNKAITPTLDIAKAAAEKAAYAKGRINDVMVPLKGISAEKAEKVIAAIDALSATFKADGFDVEKYNEAIEAVKLCELEEAAAEVILQDLAWMIKAYKVANKELDLSGVPDTPDISIGDSSEGSDSSADISSEASEASSVSELSGNEEEKDSTLLIVIIAIAAVLIIGIAVVVILKKKGKGN